MDGKEVGNNVRDCFSSVATPIRQLESIQERPDQKPVQQTLSR